MGSDYRARDSGASSESVKHFKQCELWEGEQPLMPHMSFRDL